MAMAVLKGDRAAAYALADSLLEERERGDTPLAQGYRERIRQHHMGEFEFYALPEFRALCQRVGILWDLNTVAMTITIAEGGLVTVNQTYRAVDLGPAPEPSP